MVSEVGEVCTWSGPRWEYICLDCPHTDNREENIGGEKAEHRFQVEAIMNTLGEQGWELISAVDYRPRNWRGTSAIVNVSAGLTLLFKRSKPRRE